MPDLELPPAELDVLQCLWNADAMTARQVRETLREKRPLSHSSVCTLLDRLLNKGYVTRQKGSSGKAFVYEANMAASTAQGRVLERIVESLFGGSGVDLIASLLETKPLSESELTELQKMLDSLSKQNRATGRNSGKSAMRKGKRS